MTKTPLTLSSLVFTFGIATSADAAFLQIGFDDYVSPTDNQLAREFLQADSGGVTTSLYNQSPIGGISGGSVTGYAGTDYPATAIYQPAFLDFSIPTATASLALDFFFDSQLHTLVPGANGVRSLRLGMVSSPRGAFETYGTPSAYIEGVYALDLNQMLLVARSQTAGPVTSLTLAQVALTPNSWYRINVDFTNTGSDNIHWDTRLWGLGATGDATPSLLSLGAWDYQNASITTDSSLHAAFSALADGGIPKVDNLTISNFTVAPVPIPAAFWLFGFGLAVLFGSSRWRESAARH